MPYAKKVVLYCRQGASLRLGPLVEEFIKDGVIFVAVVGKDCARVEDLVDWVVIGPNGTRDYELLTSSRPEQSIEEVVEFAKSLTGAFSGDEVQGSSLPRMSRPNPAGAKAASSTCSRRGTFACYTLCEVL